MKHEYQGCLRWNAGGATTRDYASYPREYTVEVQGKAPLTLSANHAFRGSADLHDPEDLLLAAVSGCHMLTYLALCARAGVEVTAYADRAEGVLVTTPQGGHFEVIRLRPHVTVREPSMAHRAQELHEVAHRQCFIASSCRIPIEVHPGSATEEA